MAKPRINPSRILSIGESNAIPRDRFPVYVVAVRGYYLDSQGKRGMNDRGMFDDALFIVARDPKGGDMVLPFNGNTDPAGWKHGRATLSTGIHMMGPGPHNVSKGTSRMYPAFRQAEVFTVTRDGWKSRDRGFFGINLHKAAGVFGSWGQTSSAGCQTVVADQWQDFHDTLKALLAQQGNEPGSIDLRLWDPKRWDKVPLFPYVLIDETERRAGRLVVSTRFKT